MRIGQFARRLGVSPDTVRRLEQRGVLTPTRDWAGQRRFTDADLAQARAALFHHAQAIKDQRGPDAA